MIDLDRLLDVTSLVRREAIRRDAGSARDPRFDVPMAVLLDLADELLPSASDVDRMVEIMHGAVGALPMPVGGGFLYEPLPDGRAALDGCTNDAACESDAHLSTCPRRYR